MSVPPVRAFNIEPIRPIPTTLQKRENGTKLGIALITLGSLAVLGAAGLITFTVMKHSPSSNLFKGFVGGGAGMVVIGLSGIGTGIYFIKKSYWKDPIVCNEAKEEIERNNYTFQQILDRYPAKALKRIISEAKLAEKFLAYVENIDYSKVVQSFYGNHPLMDRSVNPWGIKKFNDDFIPLRVLENKAIAEINSYCCDPNSNIVDPELIHRHFERKDITNPLRNGVANWTTFRDAFERAAKVYAYGQMKTCLVGIMPEKDLRIGLAYQFRRVHNNNFSSFMRFHGANFYDMFRDNVVIDINDERRAIDDPKIEQLFMDEVRNAVIQEVVQDESLTAPQLVVKYGAGINLIITDRERIYILVKDLSKLPLRFDQLRSHFHPMDIFPLLDIIAAPGDKILQQFLVRLKEGFLFAVERQIRADGFCEAYRKFTHDLIKSAQAWDFSLFIVNYNEANRVFNTTKFAAENEERGAVSAAEIRLATQLQPFVNAIQMCKNASAMHQLDYNTKLGVLNSRIAALKNQYNLATARNPYARSVFNANMGITPFIGNCHLQVTNLRYQGRSVPPVNEAAIRRAFQEKDAYYHAKFHVDQEIINLTAWNTRENLRLQIALTAAELSLTENRKPFDKEKEAAVTRAGNVRAAKIRAAENQRSVAYKRIDDEFARRYLDKHEEPKNKKFNESEELEEIEVARHSMNLEASKPAPRPAAAAPSSSDQVDDGPVVIQPIVVPGAPPPSGFQPLPGL